ncbi:MAG: thioredoxin domain-containing protein [Candidatus Anstonellaceae archaeon]
MKTVLAALLLSAILLFGCTAAPLPEGVTADGRPYRGAANPRVVIYEYSDFECPFCAQAVGTVDETLRAYPDSVQLQYRHFPLEVHPRGVPAAVAAECAAEQGKFWQMHDRLFANQNALSDADLAKYAQELGLDMGKFAECQKSDDALSRVESDRLEGMAKGVQATPTFFIGQSSIRGSQPISKFKQVVDSELARAR